MKPLAGGLGIAALASAMVKRALVIAVVIAGCAGPAATPIIIYVTPAPSQGAAATVKPSAVAAATLSPTAAGPTPVPATQPPPTPSFITFGDGTHLVGSEIPAGTYRTREPSSGCYWERLSGFSGDDTITNELTDDVTIVTIGKSDAGFTSEDCGTWTGDLSRITPSMTTFGPGIFIVVVDIKPGRYRNSSSDSCYWERLKNFTGDGTIANDLVDTTTIVDIKATDKGFLSEDCGTWTRI